MTPLPEMGLALRAAVAVEVMGWQNVERMTGFGYHEPPYKVSVWVDAAGKEKLLPPWESDRTAAKQVIERVEEMGLFQELTYYLRYLMPDSGFVRVGLMATAEQICLAALAIIRERKDHFAAELERRKGESGA